MAPPFFSMAWECDNAKLIYTHKGGDPLLSLNCKLLLNIPDLLNAMLLYQEAEEAQLRSNKKHAEEFQQFPQTPVLNAAVGMACLVPPVQLQAKLLSKPKHLHS